MHKFYPFYPLSLSLSLVFPLPAHLATVLPFSSGTRLPIDCETPLCGPSDLPSELRAPKGQTTTTTKLRAAKEVGTVGKGRGRAAKASVIW